MSPGRLRADLALVARGLAESRAKARAAIEAGGVTADGRPVTRPSDLVEAAARLVAVPAHPWVSRGGVKLAHALDAFGFDPAGRACLDAGASTGGFTQVLLERGARHVTAADVGHGQLHPRLQGHPRLTSLEGRDARGLTPADLPEPPSLVVADLSFIPLALVLPALLPLAAARADLVLLVKPQFEAGRGAARRGIVRDEVLRAAAVEGVARVVAGLGWRVRGTVPSPIAGGDGNAETLLAASRGQPPGT